MEERREETTKLTNEERGYSGRKEMSRRKDGGRKGRNI